MRLTTYFKHFVFTELFDLNSNLNNLLESSSIEDFLVDFLVDFIYIYIYICNHENNVSSRLSPQWLCGNSYTWAHNVRFEHSEI